MRFQKFSIDLIREVLDYDPETGVFRWRVTVGNGRNTRYPGDIAGSVQKNGYVMIGMDRTKLLAHRVAWAHFYGEWPEKLIDHINRNPTDNRISNLRIADHSENMRNRPKPKNNTSGIKGVSFDKRRGKWNASLWVRGKKKHLGYFSDISSAAQARKSAAEEIFGEFNFTEEFDHG